MPLDMPNDQNTIEWQITEVKKGSGRTLKIHGYRKSRAILLRQLSPEMLMASMEIDRAYDDRSKIFGCGFLGAKTVNLFSNGGGVDLSEEIIDAMRKRIHRLTKWENLCAPFLREIVYALNQTEQTTRAVAEKKDWYLDEKKKKPNTGLVTMYYKEGLRMYCKLNGLE